MLDFRSVRYKKKHMFEDEAEIISELEDQEDQSSKHSMIDLSEKIEPSVNSNNRKCQKTTINQEIIQSKQTRGKNNQN